MTKQIKAFKYRIYPTKEQSELIDKTIGCGRFVFNFGLAKHQEKESLWLTVNEMVQNGYFPDNQFKTDYFKASFYEGYLPLCKNHTNLVKSKQCIDSLNLSNFSIIPTMK